MEHARLEDFTDRIKPRAASNLLLWGIVAFFVIFFWAAYEQTGSSMNLFADKNTDLSVGSFNIPSSWFQSVNPFDILIFAPIFAAIWSLGSRCSRSGSFSWWSAAPAPIRLCW